MTQTVQHMKTETNTGEDRWYKVKMRRMLDLLTVVLSYSHLVPPASKMQNPCTEASKKAFFAKKTPADNQRPAFCATQIGIENC